MDGQALSIIGHRSAAGLSPENTIGGNALAADMEADLIETDVLVTADDQLVAMHEETLGRTTNVKEVYAPRNGGYNVADFTLAEV